jgi:hypothetical protein
MMVVRQAADPHFLSKEVRWKAIKLKIDLHLLSFS